MKKLFIDGASGTAGMEICSLLAKHPSLKIIEPKNKDSHSLSARAACIQEADAIVLCLPPEAVPEAMEIVGEFNIPLIDTSPAKRLCDGWCYGMPELCPGQRERIRISKRIANPGCFATGFILSVRPLIELNILAPHSPLSCFATAGYSAGGKSFVQRYEASGSEPSVRYMYLNQKHHQIPEMQHYSGLCSPPLFVPTIGKFRRGLITVVPIAGHSSAEIRSVLCSYYADEPFVKVSRTSIVNEIPEIDLVSNQVTLSVAGDGQGCTICAKLDNLGKGSAGSAVQNLNLLLGFGEAVGL